MLTIDNIDMGMGDTVDGNHLLDLGMEHHANAFKKIFDLFRKNFR